MQGSAIYFAARKSERLNRSKLNGIKPFSMGALLETPRQAPLTPDSGSISHFT